MSRKKGFEFGRRRWNGALRGLAHESVTVPERGGKSPLRKPDNDLKLEVL